MRFSHDLTTKKNQRNWKFNLDVCMYSGHVYILMKNTLEFFMCCLLNSGAAMEWSLDFAWFEASRIRITLTMSIRKYTQRHINWAVASSCFISYGTNLLFGNGEPFIKYILLGWDFCEWKMCARMRTDLSVLLSHWKIHCIQRQQMHFNATDSIIRGCCQWTKAWEKNLAHKHADTSTYRVSEHILVFLGQCFSETLKMRTEKYSSLHSLAHATGK